MGNLLGHIDKDATNTVDAGGNVVATGAEGGNVAADSSKGLSSGQMAMRKLLQGGLTGAGVGIQQQSKPQMSPSQNTIVPTTPAPVVSYGDDPNNPQNIIQLLMARRAQGLR